MYTLLLDKKLNQERLSMLRFRVTAERAFESPLHVLPQLIELLNEKNLGSYAIHLLRNNFGRFDFELLCESPLIELGMSTIDLRKKVGRLHHFFYELRLTQGECIDYEDFFHALKQYATDMNTKRLDEELFSLPVKWHGLLETYHFLHLDAIPDEDAYHRILRETDEHWIAPPLNHRPCPFDTDVFLQDQVIHGFEHFLVSVNYCPIGDSAFHVMIIPFKHGVDLRTATPDMMFEFEAVLRASIALWPEGDGELAIYLQKHAQSGMTVPHLHIHVVSPSSNRRFREDIIQQLRYFASSLDKREEEANAFRRMPLTSEAMRRQVWRFKKPLKQSFDHEIRKQQQICRVLSPKIVNVSQRRKRAAVRRL